MPAFNSTIPWRRTCDFLVPTDGTDTYLCMLGEQATIPPQSSPDFIKLEHRTEHSMTAMLAVTNFPPGTQAPDIVWEEFDRSAERYWTGRRHFNFHTYAIDQMTHTLLQRTYYDITRDKDERPLTKITTYLDAWMDILQQWYASLDPLPPTVDIILGLWNWRGGLGDPHHRVRFHWIKTLAERNRLLDSSFTCWFLNLDVNYAISDDEAQSLKLRLPAHDPIAAQRVIEEAVSEEGKRLNERHLNGALWLDRRNRLKAFLNEAQIQLMVFVDRVITPF